MTPFAGDVFLADARDEQRRRVLVLSDARFHRSTGRAIVAPATLPLERLLEACGRVDADTLRRAQRAVLMSL